MVVLGAECTVAVSGKEGNRKSGLSQTRPSLHTSAQVPPPVACLLGRAQAVTLRDLQGF